MSTRAPSLGRGCRAQRGGVGFLFGRRSRLLFAFPIGEGGPRSGARVLSQTAYLRRSFPLFFIPLEPYPARSARHLPHAGKALSVVILFLHVSCIRFDDARKAVDRVLAESGIWRKRISLYRELSFIAKSPYPPFGHLPPVGKAVMREEFFRRTSGIALYIYSRRSRHLHS